MKLAPLMTTTVGSFPRPAWLAETDRSARPNDLSSMSGHGADLHRKQAVASALGRRRAICCPIVPSATHKALRVLVDCVS